MTKYSWHPPKISTGQECEFVCHDGTRRFGRCMWVETRYDSSGGAHHVYAMRPIGWVLRLWVGDKDIIIPE